MRTAGDARRYDRRIVVLVGAVTLLWLAPYLLAYVVPRPASGRLANYDQGHAGVRIDGGEIDLYRLRSGDGILIPPQVALLTWDGTDGWSLDLVAAPGDYSHGALYRDDHEFRPRANFDSKTCAIAYDEVSTTRVAGSIHCRGLVLWSQSSVENNKPLDRPPLDLDATFEATGSAVLPTPTR